MAKHAAPQKPAEPQKASVARSTTLMTVATFGSRITGLVRTWAMAFALGNTFITSAYQVANNMPNMVYELVAGGLLGAAFIPVYLLQKEGHDGGDGNGFACNMLNLTIVVLGLLSVLCTVFAPAVIATQTFATGPADEVSRYAVLFFRIFAVQILLYGIGGIVTGILNANRVYFLPSIAPALNNAVVIASFFAYIPLSAVDPDLALLVLGGGTSLGVVVQFAIQLPALRRIGFKWRPRIDLRDPALLEALKIAVPTAIYIAGTMVAFSCRNAFSLQTGENGPATLLYAWTWYQLPYGVFAVSLARALFTEMSEDAAKGRKRQLRQHISSGISGTLLVIIPLAGLMGALATPLMQLFQAGAFNAEDAAYVGSILALWAVSLPFYSVFMYMYNVYASLRKFMLFAAVSTVLVVVQCLLYMVLCPTDVLGLAGVPIADLAYYGIGAIVLAVILVNLVGPYHIGSIISQAVRVLLATFVGVVAVLLLQGLLPFTSSSMLTGLATLLVCGAAGLVVIFGLCAVLRVPQMAMLAGLAKRLLRR